MYCKVERTHIIVTTILKVAPLPYRDEIKSAIEVILYTLQILIILRKTIQQSGIIIVVPMKTAKNSTPFETACPTEP